MARDARQNRAGRPGNGAAWRIWVDTGGTFTDCIALDPGGRVRRAKVLSTSCLRASVGETVGPGRWRVRQRWGGDARAITGMGVRRVGADAVERDPCSVVGFDPASSVLDVSGREAPAPGCLIELYGPEEAPVLGARLVTGTALGEALPPIEMRLGTTRGTNALLERRGGRVALVVSRGFADLLEIGTQQRPELFALKIEKPAPLYEAVLEVEGRLDARGRELRPLDLATVRAAGAALVARGIRSAAVALMHAWVNPAHEEAVAEALLAEGFQHVSVSSGLARAIRVLPRAQTAVVNAYLSGAIEPYLRGVEGALGGGRLRLMTSAGGLVGGADFAPKDSLLSGPAGGVVGAIAAGRAAGQERIIAFDMGGTSTDVSRFDGVPEYVFEHRVGGAEVLAPALAVESVAAGGGSECWLDGAMLAVGPRSAGASPGPACYGAGGPVTITDCNLLLGRLDPAGFQVPVDPRPARDRLEALAGQLERETGAAQDRDALLEGWLEVAIERMAEAIREVSVRRGYDPAEYALLAFGGAGGQVACALAARLGMTRIVIPADAGLLSALGLGMARVERVAQRQVLKELDEIGNGLDGLLAEVAAEAGEKLAGEGVSDWGVVRRIAGLRLAGQDATLDVDLAPGEGARELRARFQERYGAVYGHAPPARPVELESLRIVAAERSPGGVELKDSPPVPGGAPERRTAEQRARFGGEWVEAPVYRRGSLRAGATMEGPALVTEEHATTVVEPGWACRPDVSGALILERTSRPPPEPRRQPIRVEVATGRLSAIARHMGEMLRRTALSTNVKERLDFSCAVLDAEGRLVVNAPHVPVHLGSLGVCVRALRGALEMREGDVVVTNHPRYGGSHLPDVTVVTPVFSGGVLMAYVASRAHHAEIGGVRPGSMPVGARSLAEEGVVIPPLHLVRAGVARWEGLERLLRGSPYPSRAVEENLADLRAQMAANHFGAAALTAFAAEAGLEALRGAGEALAARAEAGIRRALRAIGANVRMLEARETLDDGSPIQVRIGLSPSGEASIDFAGSAGVHPGNLNATEAIVRSAVIYVLRLLVDEPLPLNEGLLRPVTIAVPPGMLNPPFDQDPSRCPAVAGGNVETSQRVVDTLLKALGLCACSQGTMNNVVFGNARFGYYETVCGGAGAGPGFAGASAVHTHMTNTRITDPELLEHRYPARLERFAVRQGSGGKGQWQGGDGVVREIAFLEPCSLSLISQHRVEGPYGVAGGQPGAPGAQRIVRVGGAEERLGPIAAAEVSPGDRLILETPGGGGFGPSPPA